MQKGLLGVFFLICLSDFVSFCLFKTASEAGRRGRFAVEAVNPTTISTSVHPMVDVLWLQPVLFVCSQDQYT